MTKTGGGEGGRRGRGADRVGDLLAGVFRKLGLSEEVARQGALGRWEGVVGARIAAVTRPTVVAGGTLFVQVASSAWLNELTLMRHDILARLNAGREEGRIERIVLTLWERPEAYGEGERHAEAKGNGTPPEDSEC